MPRSPRGTSIRKMTRDDARFYEYFGPVFGSRQIAKEVGIHCYDDDDKTWFAAFRGRSLIGWLSVRGNLVSDCYVVPEHRGQHIFDGLLSSAISWHKGPLRAVCTAASVPAFKKAGFLATRKTKNFTAMERKNA